MQYEDLIISKIETTHEKRPSMKASLKAILLCVFLAVGFSSYVPAVELEGEIVVDTVWSKSLSPYILTDDVIIEEDVTLTIEPGVVVQFEKTGSSDGYHLEVRGTLQARGIENDPILFTIDDLEYNWGHIEFTSTSTPWEAAGQTGCIIEYCILEYGGNGRVDARERAAIRISIVRRYESYRRLHRYRGI